MFIGSIVDALLNDGESNNELKRESFMNRELDMFMVVVAGGGADVGAPCA